MKIRHILLFSPAGFLLQVFLFICCPYAENPNRDWLLSPYAPWLHLGEILDRNSGSGGHAFQGGAILGILLGVLFYSLLIGTVIAYFYVKRIQKHMPFNNLK
jgi:hypothetical protein